MAKSKVVSAWLPVDLIDEVDRSAACCSLSRNALIRLALQRAVTDGLCDSFVDDGLDRVVVQQPSHRSAP